MAHVRSSELPAGESLERALAAVLASQPQVRAAWTLALYCRSPQSAHHLGDALDWLDDVAARDRVRPAAVLDDPALRAALARATLRASRLTAAVRRDPSGLELPREIRFTERRHPSVRKENLA